MQCLEEGGFTSSIGSNQGDSSLLVDVHVDSVDNNSVGIVSDDSLVESKHRWRKLLWIGEDEHASGIMNDILNDIHSLDALDSGLDQGCSCCTVSELVDELLDVLDLVLLGISLSSLELKLLVSDFLEIVKVTFVIEELLVKEVNHFVHGSI